MPTMDFSQPLIVSIILGISLVLFISDKLRVDFIAILVMLSLVLTGLINEHQAFSGFSSPAIMTVVCMFVLSEGLRRTGIVRWLAGHLQRIVGRSQGQLSAVLMVVCGFFSSFTSNTATVAILLPVTIRLAKERGINPSRILMPLSFSAQFGGVCTLVGTSTNLLVHAIAQEHGYEGFSMFEFTKLGLVCFVVGMAYMLLASYFLLPDSAQSEDSKVDQYRLNDYLLEMRILEGSPLIGQTGEDNDLVKLGMDENRPSILEIIRDKELIWSPGKTVIRENDVVLIRGDVSIVLEAEKRLKIEDWAEGNLSDVHLKSDDITVVEALIASGSSIVGKTLTQVDFYWRYHAAVLAVRRQGGEVLKQRVSSIQLQEGDALLLQGHRKDLEQLDTFDFVLTQNLGELRLNTSRALVAFGIMAAVLGCAASGIVPVATAAFIGAVAMVATKCLRPSQAYSSINFQIIVLLAGLIPLGLAIESSGSSKMVVDTLMELVGDNGPVAAMAGVYLVTMVLTAFMSNAATAVIMAPLSFAIAEQMGVSVQPFLVSVAFAASTCFSTPVGYQTNVMIYTPGGYKYTDFVKVGLPLNILFFVICVTLIPMFWEF
jgi:di/tricarboxylate transporter